MEQESETFKKQLVFPSTSLQEDLQQVHKIKAL